MYKLQVIDPVTLDSQNIDAQDTLDAILDKIHYYGLGDSTGDPSRLNSFRDHTIQVSDGYSHWIYNRETRLLEEQ